MRRFFSSRSLKFSAQIMMCFVFLFFQNKKSVAQASLGFYNLSVPVSNVNFGDSIPVTVTLKNYSLYNFQGTISTRFSVNGNLQSDSLQPIYFNNFPAGDTQQIFFVLYHLLIFIFFIHLLIYFS